MFSWGDHKFMPDTAQKFELGNLELQLSRSRLEWITEYHYHQDRYVNESRKEVALFRTISNDSSDQLRLLPSTADRNVVVRPVQGIKIPHGESANLFVSTPIWLQAVIPNSNHMLFDLPVEILSDTWFGANTWDGEICYSNQTQARLYLEKLSLRPERIITSVKITNEGGDTLNVERLNIPMPYFSVYDTGASLWSQHFEIIRTGKLETAELKFQAKPPPDFPESVLVNTPRMTEDSNLVARTIGLLFDEGQSA